jgi:catechol 2,3-dioxygenase-like lactoylglutathione lyase family enzyme
MEPRLDLLTVAVPDVEAARRFYVDGLGWSPRLDVAGEVVFLQVNAGLLLALFGAADLAADMGLPAQDVAPGGGFTLAHNVGSPDEVRQVVATAEAAGARVLKAPQPAAFGGFHGYFADPAGIRWEVAHNPGLRVDPDGTVHIGVVEAGSADG